MHIHGTLITYSSNPRKGTVGANKSLSERLSMIGPSRLTTNQTGSSHIAPAAVCHEKQPRLSLGLPGTASESGELVSWFLVMQGHSLLGFFPERTFEKDFYHGKHRKPCQIVFIIICIDMVTHVCLSCEPKLVYHSHNRDDISCHYCQNCDNY